MGSIIGLLVFVALIGLAAWALTTLIPMPPGVAKIIYVVAVILCVLIVLNAFGLLDGAGGRVSLPKFSTAR
jgi:hypothetical protein